MQQPSPNRAPDVLESLTRMFDALLSEVHTTLPATITAVHGGLVDVQPTLMRVFLDGAGNEVPTPYPVITNRPVAWPGGGGCYITLPIAVGDPCLLLVAQQSLDAWLETDGKTPIDPVESTRHHFGNAFVYPGGRTARNPIPNISSTDIVIGVASGARILLGGPGVTGAGNALVRESDLDALVQKFLTHIHPTPMGPSGPTTSVHTTTASSTSFSQ